MGWILGRHPVSCARKIAREFVAAEENYDVAEIANESIAKERQTHEVGLLQTGDGLRIPTGRVPNGEICREEEKT